jgi:hypothetical protein
MRGCDGECGLECKGLRWVRRLNELASLRISVHGRCIQEVKRKGRRPDKSRTEEKRTKADETRYHGSNDLDWNGGTCGTHTAIDPAGRQDEKSIGIVAGFGTEEGHTS